MIRAQSPRPLFCRPYCCVFHRNHLPYTVRFVYPNAAAAAVQLGSSFNSIATSIMIYCSDREFFGCLCGLVVNWGILLLMTFSINDFGSKNFNSVRTFWIALCFIPVQEAFAIVRPLLTVHSR